MARHRATDLAQGRWRATCAGGAGIWFVLYRKACAFVPDVQEATAVVGIAFCLTNVLNLSQRNGSIELWPVDFDLCEQRFNRMKIVLGRFSNSELLTCLADSKTDSQRTVGTRRTVRERAKAIVRPGCAVDTSAPAGGRGCQAWWTK